MTTTNRFSFSTAAFLVVGAAIVVSSLFAMSIPNAAHAADFAYVNTSGNVSIVTANDWMSAIATAPSIAIHSGVMLLDNLSNVILGNHVNGA